MQVNLLLENWIYLSPFQNALHTHLPDQPYGCDLAALPVAGEKESKNSQGAISFTSEQSEQWRGLSSRPDSPADDSSLLRWLDRVLPMRYPYTLQQFCCGGTWVSSLCHLKGPGVIGLAEQAFAECLDSHLSTCTLLSFTTFTWVVVNVAVQFGLWSVR